MRIAIRRARAGVLPSTQPKAPRSVLAVGEEDREAGRQSGGLAAHHAEHLPTTSAEEPRHAHCREREGEDVEDSGVVQGDAGFGDLDAVGVRHEAESAEEQARPGSRRRPW